MAVLAYRHNPVTRITHWINVVALVVLFMSGLQIFNAFSELHWGNKAEPGEAWLAIGATRGDEEIRGVTVFLGKKFDTTGVLGVQDTDMGPAVRAFPSWITIPGYFWLAGGRRWHFFFAWLFVLNGLVYVIYNAFNGHMRKFFFTPRHVARVPAMVLYYLHFRRESPQVEEYNPLQAMAYTGVFLILTPLVVATGLAMSPQLDFAFPWLPAIFGGRQSARSVHFILTFAFLLFTLGHVFMVLVTGVFNNMRSMVTGWYREKTAIAAESRTAAPASPAEDASARPHGEALNAPGDGEKDGPPQHATSAGEPPVAVESNASTGEESKTHEQKNP